MVDESGPEWSLNAWAISRDGRFAEHQTVLTTPRGFAYTFALSPAGGAFVTERTFATDPSSAVLHQLSWAEERVTDEGRTVATGVDGRELALAEGTNGWLTVYSRSGWNVPTPYGFVPPRVFGRFVYGR